MRIFAKPSFHRAFKKLTPQEQASVQATIAELAEAVGQPHWHSGLGIRPFGKYFEGRAGLKIRVLFFFDKGNVVLATTGDHNAIARYVKEN